MQKSITSLFILFLSLFGVGNFVVAQEMEGVSKQLPLPEGKIGWAYFDAAATGISRIGVSSAVDNYQVMYIKIEGAELDALRGCSIEAVDVGLARNIGVERWVSISTVSPISTLDYPVNPGDAFYMQPYNGVSKDDIPSEAPQGYPLNIGFKRVTLDKPYLIQNQKELYVGYCVHKNDSKEAGDPADVPFMVMTIDENAAHSANDGYLSFRYPNSPQNAEWQSSDGNGKPLAIKLILSNPNGVFTNKATMDDVSVTPIYLSDGELTVNCKFHNLGTNPLKSVTLSARVDGKEIQQFEASLNSIPSMGFSPMNTFKFSDTNIFKEGKNTLSLHLIKVNGVAVDNISQSLIFAKKNQIPNANAFVEVVGLATEDSYPATEAIVAAELGKVADSENVIYYFTHSEFNRKKKDGYSLLSDDGRNENLFSGLAFLFNRNLFTPALLLNRVPSGVYGGQVPDGTGGFKKAPALPFVVNGSLHTIIDKYVKENKRFFDIELTTSKTEDSNNVAFHLAIKPLVEGISPFHNGNYAYGLMIVQDSIPDKLHEEQIHNGVPLAVYDTHGILKGIYGNAFVPDANGTFETDGEIVIVDNRDFSVDLSKARAIAWVCKVDGASFPILHAVQCPVGGSYVEAPMLKSPNGIPFVQNGVCYNLKLGDAIEIYNMSGQLCIKARASDLSMDTALPPGCYILKVKRNSQVTAVKFIVR